MDAKTLIEQTEIQMVRNKKRKMKCVAFFGVNMDTPTDTALYRNWCEENNLNLEMKDKPCKLYDIIISL